VGDRHVRPPEGFAVGSLSWIAATPATRLRAEALALRAARPEGLLGLELEKPIPEPDQLEAMARQLGRDLADLGQRRIGGIDVVKAGHPPILRARRAAAVNRAQGAMTGCWDAAHATGRPDGAPR